MIRNSACAGCCCCSSGSWSAATHMHVHTCICICICTSLHLRFPQWCTLSNSFNEVLLRLPWAQVGAVWRQTTNLQLSQTVPILFSPQNAHNLSDTAHIPYMHSTFDRILCYCSSCFSRMHAYSSLVVEHCPTNPGIKCCPTSPRLIVFDSSHINQSIFIAAIKSN